MSLHGLLQEREALIDQRLFHGFHQEADFEFGAGVTDEDAAIVAELFLDLKDGLGEAGDFFNGWFLANGEVEQLGGVGRHAGREFPQGFARALHQA